MKKKISRNNRRQRNENRRHHRNVYGESIISAHQKNELSQLSARIIGVHLSRNVGAHHQRSISTSASAKAGGIEISAPHAPRRYGGAGNRQKCLWRPLAARSAGGISAYQRAILPAHRRAGQRIGAAHALRSGSAKAAAAALRRTWHRRSWPLSASAAQPRNVAGYVAAGAA